MLEMAMVDIHLEKENYFWFEVLKRFQKCAAVHFEETRSRPGIVPLLCD